MERRDGTSEERGAGVGERSRSVGHILAKGDNPQDRAAATFAAPEPAIHYSWMHSRSGVERGVVLPAFPALAIGGFLTGGTPHG